MRATGVGVKLARRCNSSHRICQFRPHAKLSTSAAKIAKTITSVTVIEYILRARPPACRARGYRILSPGLARAADVLDDHAPRLRRAASGGRMSKRISNECASEIIKIAYEWQPDSACPA